MVAKSSVMCIPKFFTRLPWKTTAERFRAAPKRGKVRRFAQFYDAAHSWSRVERIIARLEAGPEGTDTRFIVTSLEGGRAKHLYEGLYCARGRAEEPHQGVEKP